VAISRLHTLDADLAAVIATSPPSHRQNAAWAAARWAVSRVGLAHPAITAALADGQLGELSAVAAELDELYLAADESEAAPSTVLAAFGRARAASAVEFAARGETEEAVYEAAIATADLPGTRAVIASVLGGGTGAGAT
jgi:hypothetical protein